MGRLKAVAARVVVWGAPLRAASEVAQELSDQEFEACGEDGEGCQKDGGVVWRRMRQKDGRRWREYVAAPQRCERACQLTTRAFALRVGSAIHLSMQRSAKLAMPMIPPQRAYRVPSSPKVRMRSLSSVRVATVLEGSDTGATGRRMRCIVAGIVMRS